MTWVELIFRRGLQTPSIRKCIYMPDSALENVYIYIYIDNKEKDNQTSGTKNKVIYI